MAYTGFNYSAISGSSNPLTNLQNADKNDIAVLDAIIAEGGFFGWDTQHEQPAGTYPPTDPAHPARIIATRNDDTNYKIRATLTWSGDKVTDTVYEKTLNGGTAWDKMYSTNGKITYTFSAVSGYETYVIATTWS